MTSIYLDFLSKFGVGGAHPGGIQLTKELFKSETITPTTHILDVGCGTGQTAAYLAAQYGAIVTGIDNNPVMVEKAKNENGKIPITGQNYSRIYREFPIKGRNI